MGEVGTKFNNRTCENSGIAGLSPDVDKMWIIEKGGSKRKQNSHSQPQEQQRFAVLEKRILYTQNKLPVGLGLKTRIEGLGRIIPRRD